jgi:hypothetical protein
MSRDIEITIDREVIAELTGAKPKQCDLILDKLFVHQDVLLEQIDETLRNMIGDFRQWEEMTS